MHGRGTICIGRSSRWRRGCAGGGSASRRGVQDLSSFGNNTGFALGKWLVGCAVVTNLHTTLATDVSHLRVAVRECIVTATVGFKNTGRRTGAEVMQFYVSLSGAEAPDDFVSRLGAFSRAEPMPEESRTGIVHPLAKIVKKCVSSLKRGSEYANSWRDGVRPNRQVLADRRPGVIELAANMTFGDWMYGLTHRFSPRYMFPCEHVPSI